MLSVGVWAAVRRVDFALGSFARLSSGCRSILVGPEKIRECLGGELMAVLLNELFSFI